jgi:hypothetical protein
MTLKRLEEIYLKHFVGTTIDMGDVFHEIMSELETEERRRTVPSNLTHMPQMSLRDWFAGQAVNGMMHVNPQPIGWEQKTMAQYCYYMADAMLAAREEKP